MAGVEGRIAVVTGGANGLGREIALVLARAGARVAVGDLEVEGVERTAAAIRQGGGDAVAGAGDLTEEAPAARLIEAAVGRWGKLDILVNNVGGSRNSKIWEMPAADWDFVMRLNLRSTLPLHARGGAAHDGVHGFVRDVALELAEHGVNVNAVAPGPIDTERAGPNLRRLDETVEFSPSRMTPLHRIGTPVEVAHAVLFLASEEASYITGHTLAVAGGR